MAMRSERHIVPVTSTDIARFLNQKKASPSKQTSALASKNMRSSTITSTSSITEETGEKKALKGGKVKNIPQDFRRFTCKSGHEFHVVPSTWGTESSSNKVLKQLHWPAKDVANETNWSIPGFRFHTAFTSLPGSGFQIYIHHSLLAQDGVSSVIRFSSSWNFPVRVLSYIFSANRRPLSQILWQLLAMEAAVTIWLIFLSVFFVAIFCEQKTSQPNAITIACNGSGSDYIAQEEEGVPDLSNPLLEQIKPVISTTVCTNTGPVGSDISEFANSASEVLNVNKKSVSPTLAVTATRVETDDSTACHLPDKDLLKQGEAVSLEAIPSPKRCTETFLRGIETTAEPEAEVEPVETTARAHFSSDKEGRYVSRQRCNIRVVLLTGLSLVLSIWVLFWSADKGAMEQLPPTWCFLVFSWDNNNAAAMPKTTRISWHSWGLL